MLKPFQRITNYFVSTTQFNFSTNESWKGYKNSNSVTTIGFKEIRYDNGGINKIKTFLELFPDTKVIVHYRKDISAQSISSWFKTVPNSKERLAKYNGELIDFYKQNKSFCYLSTFEDMFDINKMKRLFHFLGEKLDVDKYRHIIGNNLK